MADPFFQCGADLMLGAICDKPATAFFVLREPVLLLGKISVVGVYACDDHAQKMERALASLSTKGPPTRKKV